MQPTVTACVPTLGRDSLWSTALPSLLAQDAVSQVVVAFHGADRVVDHPLLADPRVTTAVFEGATVSGVRNAAVASATGDLLYFLDDDDRSEPAAVATLQAMAAHPEVGFASGAMEVCTEAGVRGDVMVPKDQGGLYQHVVALFHAGTFVVRRDVFLEAGGYGEALTFGENYDLGIRLSQVLRARSLRAESTDEVMVSWVRSATDYGDQAARAARLLLDTYPELMAENPRERATYLAIIGVADWRAGRRRDSRRNLRAAVAAAPNGLEHWWRLGVVGPAACR